MDMQENYDPMRFPKVRSRESLLKDLIAAPAEPISETNMKGGMG